MAPVDAAEKTVRDVPAEDIKTRKGVRDSPSRSRWPRRRVIAVVSLLHPKSPAQRVLCDQNTGSGKTLIMLIQLDQSALPG